MRCRLVLVTATALCVSVAGVSLVAQGGQQAKEPRGRASVVNRREPPADAGPAPRSASGRVLLGGATPSDKGVWTPLFGILDPILEFGKVPFQPWARALYVDRQGHELEPHARCKASGISRQFLTPYGVEFVEVPELQQIYIFDIGGPHTFRIVYLDGRSHPIDLKPSYYGHSIGWWEGDTLVVDTVGFNEGFWIDRGQLPHTTQLHLVEKYTRTSVGSMRYELTIDDPGAYTRPFTATSNLRWEDGTELFEYVCQQANYAGNLMVGVGTSVDRSTLTVP
jgi:hypothetical protein